MVLRSFLLERTTSGSRNRSLLPQVLLRQVAGGADKHHVGGGTGVRRGHSDHGEQQAQFRPVHGVGVLVRASCVGA